MFWKLRLQWLAINVALTVPIPGILGQHYIMVADHASRVLIGIVRLLLKRRPVFVLVHIKESSDSVCLEGQSTEDGDGEATT